MSVLHRSRLHRLMRNSNWTIPLGEIAMGRGRGEELERPVVAGARLWLGPEDRPQCAGSLSAALCRILLIDHIEEANCQISEGVRNIATIERDLVCFRAAVAHQRAPQPGAALIGLVASDVITTHRIAKHFDLTITDASFGFARNAETIAAEIATNGLYVARVGLPAEALDDAAGAQTAERRQAAILRLERPTAGREQDRHRSLPAVVGLALQRPVEPDAGRPQGKPTPQP